MNWILNIDSAVQTASISLAKDGQQVGFKINATQADHASWLQPAIASLFSEQCMDIRTLDAIAVSAGPGSYTGLRVGMATAKGLCYTLNKPLILINTLRMMAVSALSEPSAIFICPMIDARRMEVFTAVFDHSLNEIVEPHNVILSGDSFIEILNRDPVVFFGNGSEKFKNMTAHENALFKNLASTAEQMVSLSYQSFLDKNFADLAYSEPFYGKEFYSPAVIKS